VALLAPLGIEPEGIADDTLVGCIIFWIPRAAKYDLADLAREALGIEARA